MITYFKNAFKFHAMRVKQSRGRPKAVPSSLTTSTPSEAQPEVISEKTDDERENVSEQGTLKNRKDESTKDPLKIDTT